MAAPERVEVSGVFMFDVLGGYVKALVMVERRSATSWVVQWVGMMPWAWARWSFAAYIGYPTPQCILGMRSTKVRSHETGATGVVRGTGRERVSPSSTASLISCSTVPLQTPFLFSRSSWIPMRVVSEVPHRFIRAVHFVLGEEAGVVGVSD